MRNSPTTTRSPTEAERPAGLGRESLYRSLSRRGNPKIETLMVLLNTLGLKLTIERGKAAWPPMEIRGPELTSDLPGPCDSTADQTGSSEVRGRRHARE